MVQKLNKILTNKCLHMYLFLLLLMLYKYIIYILQLLSNHKIQIILASTVDEYICIR